MALSIYKKGQGTAARGTAGVVVILLAGWASRQMWFTMEGWSVVTQAIAAGIVALVFGALPLYLILFRPQIADLLIETQQEMRKVAWSSRRELFGSTAVVIVTVTFLALLIFVMDWLLLRIAGFLGIY